MNAFRFAGPLLLGAVLATLPAAASDDNATQRMLDRAQAQSNRHNGGDLLRQVETQLQTAPHARVASPDRKDRLPAAPIDTPASAPDAPDRPAGK